MASPICKVNGGSTEFGSYVATDATVVIALASGAGVSNWQIACWSSDGNAYSAEDVNSILVVDQIARTATFTMPSDPGTFLFRSIVNQGRGTNGEIRPDYTATFAVYSPLSGGLRYFAPSETTEFGPVKGWTDGLNNLVYATANGGGGGSFTAGGDLSGSASSQTVVKIQGRAVSASAPSSGNMLAWNGSAWAPTSPASFTAGGDLTGSSSSQTVAKINGTSVPAGGSLTTGTVLRATGAASSGWGALDLANASAVTGVLPLANIAKGSDGYVLTGKGASNSAYQNSIAGMTSVSSNAFTVSVNGSAAKTENYSVALQTTNATPQLASTITLAASRGISLTVKATGADGYTTYGTSKRVWFKTKTGLFFRGSSGGATRSGFTNDTYISPDMGTPGVPWAITFDVSGNDVLVKVTGESGQTINWNVEVNVSWVEVP